MGKGGYKGKGKGKRDEPPLERDAELNRKFNAPPSATSHNVNAFLLCLSLYLRNIVVPLEEILARVPIIETFGKFLSCIFRHNQQLLHEDLSLTLNELFWFPQFQQHINNGLGYMQDPEYRYEPCFGVIDCPEVRDECKNTNEIRVSPILCAFRLCYLAELKRTFFTCSSTRRCREDSCRARLENTSNEQC